MCSERRILSLHRVCFGNLLRCDRGCVQSDSCPDGFLAGNLIGKHGRVVLSCQSGFCGCGALLIYVGGTLVLLVFGVMLTASGPYLKIITSPGEIMMGSCVGLLFLFVVFASLDGVKWREPSVAAMATGNPVVATGNTLRPIGLSFLGSRPDQDLISDGDDLTPGYLLPFEIVSVHLLVVLIGAAYLARAKRRPVGSG